MVSKIQIICVCPGMVFKKYHLNVKPANMDKQVKKLIDAVQAKYANVYQDGNFVKRIYKH